MYLSPAGCSCHNPLVSSCLWRGHPETVAKGFSSCSYRTLRNSTATCPASNGHCRVHAQKVANRVYEWISTNINDTKMEKNNSKFFFANSKHQSETESANSAHVHSPTHYTTNDKLVWNDHNHDTTVFSTNIPTYTDGHRVLKRESYMLDMEYKEVDLLCVEVKRSETTDKLPFLQKREIEQTHTPRGHIQSKEAVVHWVLLPNTHKHSLITFNGIIHQSHLHYPSHLLFTSAWALSHLMWTCSLVAFIFGFY